MDLARLRSEFPVLERLAYLNAGSAGPTPIRATRAARDDLDAQAGEARGGARHFERMAALGDRLRSRAAGLLGCSPLETALTTSTTDGVNTVLAGLHLRPGDEILTSDEEHPGLLAPLAAARERFGIVVRAAPFAELASAVRADTRLVACSHVSWITGRAMDVDAITATGKTLLLDGAQALGAIPVDVRTLGCDYYAASGQKWLCGPIGTGYLYVREARIEALSPSRPGYGVLADPVRPLDLRLVEGAARLDSGSLSTHQSAWSLAALDVLEEQGLAALQARAVALASQLAADLAETGLEVAARGPSTLVSWRAADPVAAVARLLARDILVRDLPGTPYVRASVGGWTTERELSELIRLAAT